MNNMSKPKIIFFGTPEFAVPCLTALVNGGFDVIGVVTQPDKPAGRGMKLQACPIKTKAQELGLKIFDIKNLPLADVGVCVAYGKIIPQAVLNWFPKGILNIHPSLLPKYRGPSPVQTAILNGDKKTGVTIMLLDKEMDHGHILAQNPYLISPLERGRKSGLTSGELLKQLFQIGTDLLIEILPKYLAGEIIPREQDHSKATFTKMLTREDGKIDWNKSAREIERMVRAYDPWPGTWTIYHGKRLKILKASTVPLLFKEGLGVVESKSNGGELIMQCNPGALILEQVQPEGKKPMSGQEFLRGYSKSLDTSLF